MKKIVLLTLCAVGITASLPAAEASSETQPRLKTQYPAIQHTTTWEKLSLEDSRHWSHNLEAYLPIPLTHSLPFVRGNTFNLFLNSHLTPVDRRLNFRFGDLCELDSIINLVICRTSLNPGTIEIYNNNKTLGQSDWQKNEALLITKNIRYEMCAVNLTLKKPITVGGSGHITTYMVDEVVSELVSQGFTPSPTRASASSTPAFLATPSPLLQEATSPSLAHFANQGTLRLQAQNSREEAAATHTEQTRIATALELQHQIEEEYQHLAIEQEKAAQKIKQEEKAARIAQEDAARKAKQELKEKNKKAQQALEAKAAAEKATKAEQSKRDKEEQERKTAEAAKAKAEQQTASAAQHKTHKSQTPQKDKTPAQTLSKAALKLQKQKEAAEEAFLKEESKKVVAERTEMQRKQAALKAQEEAAQKQAEAEEALQIEKGRTEIAQLQLVLSQPCSEQRPCHHASTIDRITTIKSFQQDANLFIDYIKLQSDLLSLYKHKESCVFSEKTAAALEKTIRSLLDQSCHVDAVKAFKEEQKLEWKLAKELIQETERQAILANLEKYELEYNQHDYKNFDSLPFINRQNSSNHDLTTILAHQDDAIAERAYNLFIPKWQFLYCRTDMHAFLHFHGIYNHASLGNEEGFFLGKLLCIFKSLCEHRHFANCPGDNCYVQIIIENLITNDDTKDHPLALTLVDYCLTHHQCKTVNTIQKRIDLYTKLIARDDIDSEIKAEMISRIEALIAQNEALLYEVD